MRPLPGRSIVLAVLLCGASYAPASDVCESSATPDIEACARKRLDEARLTYDRYLAEARRVAADEPKDAAGLESSQKAWREFVDVDCKAVYQHWIDGTIRGLQAITCELGHLRERTCNLWWTYLEMANTDLKPPPCKRES
jgi:uncharacterized protein YecT (DUF1311 family)